MKRPGRTQDKPQGEAIPGGGPEREPRLLARLVAEYAGTAVTQCEGDGLSATSTDCDDAHTSVHPGAAELCDGLDRGDPCQTLLGITGSGKTFTVANVIQHVQRPTLILAPNKSLAAQLAAEFRELFPRNRVEYFVSYYDYYQPEAYIPSSDTFIEKDSSINEEIDRLRHSATSALLSRRDVVIVASVSAIYGLGSPEMYARQLMTVRVGEEHEQRALLSRLVELQYERNDVSFVRNKFRVRGDTIEIFPAYEERGIRISLFGDEVERITTVDPLTGEIVEELDTMVLFPASHYATDEEQMRIAMEGIEAELGERLRWFHEHEKLLEAQRLRMRTTYDLEMMREVGFCSGIENYSRHLDGREPGQAPYTLLDYFPDDYLVVLDESHVTVPQIRGQFAGDRSRKETLVEHGFRLPSALDNRPLKFEEFERVMRQTVFVSATPADYEKGKSAQIVEQVVRPTGLVDPTITLKPLKGQIDDLIEECRKRVERKERVLIAESPSGVVDEDRDFARRVEAHAEVGTRRPHEVGDALHARLDVEVLRDILDLPEPIPFGQMLVVPLSNGVSLDFFDSDAPIAAQHYAFLISDAEFDRAFARIREKGLAYWADPAKKRPSETYQHNGGRGVYFDDPDGHFLEIMTRPYDLGS